MTSDLHSSVLVVLASSPTEVHPADVRQMHASYLIVHAPELCSVQVVTWIVEMLRAAAVNCAILPGARKKMDGGLSIG